MSDRTYTCRWCDSVVAALHDLRRGMCRACYMQDHRFADRYKQRRCLICGYGFETTRSDARYCSAACRQRARRSATTPRLPGAA